jgi:hypothetical protein
VWAIWHAWEKRRMHTVFWYKNLKEGGLLGRQECRWEDNIKMFFKEIGWKAVYWVYVA